MHRFQYVVMLLYILQRFPYFHFPVGVCRSFPGRKVDIIIYIYYSLGCLCIEC